MKIFNFVNDALGSRDMMSMEQRYYYPNDGVSKMCPSALSSVDSSVYETLAAMLSLRLGLKEKDSSGRTLLFRAAQRGRLDLVKTFIALGCDLEASNLAGQTPLFVACYAKHMPTVSFLLGNTCDAKNGC